MLYAVNSPASDRQLREDTTENQYSKFFLLKFGYSDVTDIKTETTML